MKKIKKKFQERITSRLFTNERKKIKQIITHKKIDGWENKYESEGHFIRCAIIQLIRQEQPNLTIKRGRPRKPKK